MKFESLKYTDQRGVYEEDPDTTAMQVKMERALVAKAGREVRRLMSQVSWVYHKHGCAQTAMSLGVSFQIVTAADIALIENKAREAERKRLSSRVWDALDGVLDNVDIRGGNRA